MKKILAVLILLFTAQSAFAIGEIKAISLSDAVKIALKENPQNKMAQLDINIAKKDAKIANKLKNPDLFFYQNLGRAGMGNPQQLGMSYNFELFKRNKRKKVANANISISEYNKQSYEIDLEYRVKEAYFNLLLSKSNHKILEQQKELSKKIRDNAMKELGKGNITHPDMILAKIEYNKAIMYYNESEARLISAKNQFNSVMNTSDLEYDSTEDRLDNNYSKFLTANPTEVNINLTTIKDYVFKHRYDLMRAKSEVESAKANLEVVKSQLIPDVELFGGWSYQTKAISESETFENGAYLGANITNIPLVYLYKPEIQKARFEIEKAELKYQDLLIDVTRNVTDAWESFVIAKDNLNFYNKELLNNSKELRDVSLKGLKNKEINLTEFLLAEKTFLELQLGYANALHEYYLSYATLLKELNISDIKEIEKM